MITYKDLTCKICNGTGDDQFNYSYTVGSSDIQYVTCKECGGSGKRDLEIDNDHMVKKNI